MVCRHPQNRSVFRLHFLVKEGFSSTVRTGFGRGVFGMGLSFGTCRGSCVKVSSIPSFLHPLGHFKGVPADPEALLGAFVVSFASDSGFSNGGKPRNQSVFFFCPPGKVFKRHSTFSYYYSLKKPSEESTAWNPRTIWCD